MLSSGTVVDRGLEGVVVGTTELSRVEGAEGRLTYRSHSIDDLASYAKFEEVCEQTPMPRAAMERPAKSWRCCRSWIRGGRRSFANVEFYTAPILGCLGVPSIGAMEN